MTAGADSDRRKREAAQRALDLVEPGMRLGLGSGTTASHFVDLLGDKVAAGFDVLCVATSEATATQAKARGIPMATLDELPELDLTVDGADEIDPRTEAHQGRRGRASAREDRRCSLAANGGHRRCEQARPPSRRLSAAGRGRPIRARGDQATYRARLRGPWHRRALSGCGAERGPSSLTGAISFSIARSAPSPIRTAWQRPFRRSRAL